MFQKTLAGHKFFITIVAIFVVSQIFLFSRDIGWDDSVYIGMGKHIFSSGKIGLWEEFRPPLFPFIIGFFWKFGFGIAAYKMIALIFVTILLIFVYKISLKLYDKKTATLASFILAFTPIYFFNSTRILTDIPSTAFSLLAIFLFLKNKYALSGLSTAAAILTRFPQGIVAIALIISFFYKKRISDFIRYFVGFFPLIFVYLVSNKIFYNSFFYPLIKANEAVISSAPWLYAKDHFFYFSSLIEENILLVFSLAGIYFVFKKKEFEKSYAVLIPLILFLSYFTLMQHKELRYSLAFLAYLAIFSAYGICEVWRLVKKIKFPYFVSALLLLFIILASSQYNYYSKQKIENPALKEFLMKNEINGTVLTSNPGVAAYTNNKVIPYYSLFKDAVRLYEENKINSSFIVYDSSAFPCNDEECIMKKMELFDRISSENKLMYRKGTLYVFSRP